MKIKSCTNDIVALLTLAEIYSGTGYYDNGYINPYLYSGTNVYEKGKYVEVLDENDQYTSRYDADLVDQQLGAYVMLQSILNE
ncbi:hypothetical protein LJC58_09470 [Lachnospiraceae bacterium OttesenSCG-928-D06]|nr:hypothetical protein [Lachnospiraceae bacterium OttesenSCG-928-D06]